jgi:hypothetical protein
MVGCGAMAQLVARLHGMQKVRGSNPLSSTAFFGSLFEGEAPNQEPRRLGQALSSFSSPKTPSRTVALRDRRDDGARGTQRGGGLGRLIRTSRPRYSLQRYLTCSHSMISMRP